MALMDITAFPTEHVTEDSWAFHSPHKWRHEFADNPSSALDRSRLLDNPSAPHPLLDLLMHFALARMLLLADGATAALCERVSRGKAGDWRAPRSALAEDIDGLWTAYARASTHRRRLAAIKDAQDVVTRLAYAPDRSKVRGTAEWKDAIRADPRPCRVLASVHGVSHMTISRIKRGSRLA